MSTKAELLEQLSLASQRVSERPAWMKDMRSQAKQAELYVHELDGYLAGAGQSELVARESHQD